MALFSGPSVIMQSSPTHARNMLEDASLYKEKDANAGFVNVTKSTLGKHDAAEKDQNNNYRAYSRC